MVEAARIAYRDYPTVVNEIPESGVTYDNTKSEYAKMDCKMQSAQKAIGGSSDTAQLSQSYYWDKVAKGEIDDDCRQYYENTVILAVCAQLAIDGCKKVFAVDVNNDIERIRSQECMKREKDYPEFMKWTHEIPVTKNGKERSYDDIRRDRNKVRKRVDSSIVCPMNWLEESLNKIQGVSKRDYVDTKDYFIKIPGEANRHQASKIRKMIEEYDGYTKHLLFLMQDSPDVDDYFYLLLIKTNDLLSTLNRMKISQYTINRLIGTVLGIDWGIQEENKYRQASKYVRKTLNVLYRNNREKFLKCFKNK